MIKKKLYKYWGKHFLSVAILLSLSFACKAQVLLDSIAIDTVKTYTLKNALRQDDPLTVYKLQLKNSKLDELPSEIAQFKNLQYLDLSKNKFKKFPVGVAQFTNLQYLNISINKIDMIPKELGQLVHLKRLNANQNRIVSLPPEIKYLKELKYLDLWGNDIGFFPSEISQLANTLEEIDMRVILMSTKEHNKIKALLPNTKIRFSKSCKCDF